ncbi:cadherin domain-containing protein [Luteithermobacter gelatinilyticus]|uniref:cadherin domain-containing protein n=1 Tax=Luteithermobacter gelatinilyticus TaxID=2582913 RepID=UPI0011059F45|nr:cadherin domain-containing protein [Luteithermobacter gelatinilyticus]
MSDDALGSIALGTILGAAGQNLFETVTLAALGGEDLGKAIEVALEDFGSNLEGAAKGAISSFLVGELLSQIGLEGIAGEVLQTTAGSTLSTIAGNMLDSTKAWDAGLSGANFANILGGFVGAKLASEVVNFDTIGGQIGASVGGAAGAYAAGKLLGDTLGNFLAPGLGAFVGFIVGGVVGSLFGGTPRSGADVIFDPATGEFDVNNVWAKKGGSKEAAEGLAAAAAEALNGVLGLIGGAVANEGRVSGGTYGLRKSDYTYRVDGGAFGPGDPGKRTIARTFDGDEEDAAAQLIEHGVLNALDDLRIAGGDVYLKRALYNSLDSLLAGDDVPAGLEGEALGALYGNLATAGDYKTYVENAAAINAIMAAEPDSAFAAGWIVTLQRVSELGLNKRHAADWLGGWDAWATTHGVESYGQLDLGIALNGAGQAERLLSGLDENGIGFRILDTVTQGGRDVIAGTAGADTITITGDMLAGDASLSVNGVAQDGTDMRIDTAATVHGGAGNDVIIGGDLGNELFGDGGDDLLRGGLKDDWLFGGAGADRLYAEGGDGNYLDGGAGNDELYGALGSDWLDGGAGVDVLDGNAGDDILTGGAGDGDQLRGGSGDDSYILRLGDGKDVVNDEATAAPAPTRSVKNIIEDRTTGLLAQNWAGIDRLVDVQAPAVETGKISGGHDTLILGQGITVGDLSITRSGTEAAPGDDLIVKLRIAGVDTGDQVTLTNWFNDYNRIEKLQFADGQTIDIGNFATFTMGTDGDDYIIGTAGRNFAHGGSGNDVLQLLWGDDVGIGGMGNDMVAGDQGQDIVVGGDQDDNVTGGSGNDIVSGGRDDDQLYGGAGADILAGDEGNDMVIGGSGDDVFRFGRGDGRDVLFDQWSAEFENILTSDGYQNGYYRDPETLEIKDAAGNVVLGPGQWAMNIVYDRENGILKKHVDDYLTDTTDAGTDTLEFDVGIDINDLQMVRDGDDLILGIEGYGQDPETFAEIADQITLKEWNRDWGADGKPIETFSFFNTGQLDATDIDVWGGGGTDGNDTLIGGLDKDWLTGNGGDDTIDGLTGDDILNGNAGQDILIGGGGDDVLLGGAGNDILRGDQGKDVLVGGDGTDIISYEGALSAVNVSLDGFVASSGDAANDTFYGIEGVRGTDYNDTLGGDQDANILQGGKGDDILYGQLGDDIYLFNRGDGSDIIHEQSHVKETVVDVGGNLQTPYEADWQFLGIEDFYFGSDPLFSYRLVITDGRTRETVYSQILTSSSYQTVPDHLPASGWINGYSRSSNGQEVVHTATGTLDGGQDALEFGEGISLSDLEFSQNGFDLQISLKGTTDSVTIQKFAASYARIESLELADGLAVNLGGLVLDGVGAAGDDFLAGTAGADSLSGGAGHDVLSGGDGDDTLTAGLGDDVLEGGAGADSLDGGAGMDMVRYNGSVSGVTVDLSSAMAASGGDAAGDTFSGIENVMGSAFNDTLSGDAADNQIFGRAGNDTLRGAAGADVLKGDEGDDILYGEVGEDNLFGGAGGDTLEGGTEKDSLFGGEGHDTLRGDAGDDSLYGEAGNDTLEGGEGNDVLYGGRGVDMLQGGLGDDSYLFGRNDGQNTIIDASGANEIAFAANDVSYDQLWFSRSGDDLIIEVIDGDTRVTLRNYYAAGTALRRIVTSSHSLSGDQMDDLVAAMAGTAVGAVSDAITEARAEVWQDNLFYRDRYVIKGGATLTADGRQGDYIFYAGNSYTNTITGAEGNDTIYLGSGTFYTMYGEAGDDTFRVTEGKNGRINKYYGGEGFDRILGDGSDNEIRIKVIDGIEEIDGGAGSNSLKLYTGSSSNTLDLRGLTLKNIHKIVGTTYTDTIYGTAGDEVIEGGEYGDFLYGEGGNDIFVVNGDSGYDKIYGGSGYDTVLGGDGDDVFRLLDMDSIEQIDGGLGYNVIKTGGYNSYETVDLRGVDVTNIQRLEGDSFYDTFYGSANGDIIDGKGRDDNLYGEGGDDILIGGAGKDKLYGGEGNDTVDMSSEDATYTADVDLSLGQIIWSDGTKDTLNSIENIIGSVNGDAITGDAGDNILDGHAGDDEIWGGAGDDTLIGGNGQDIFHGGDGVDTLDYSAFSLGLNIDLAAGMAVSSVVSETFDGIENIIGGSTDDNLKGNEGNNVLHGGQGDDILDGRNGNDTAVFTGNKEDYVIETDAATGHVVVTDNNLADGDDGQDLLKNIQMIQFADQTVDLSGQNQAPVLNVPLADRVATEDSPFSFVVPENAFQDADGNILTYSATFADGSAIPLEYWLQFDPLARTFTGTPVNSDVGSVSVKVTVSDGQYSTEDIFDVTVANVNDAPHALTFSGTIDENSVAGAVVGTAIVGDVDVSDSHTYSLIDPSGFFEIDDATGAVRVKPGAALDFEASNQHAISIIVTDAAGASLERGFAINVTNVNETPTDIQFTGSLEVNENTAGHILGSLEVIDPDSHLEPFGQHALKVFEVIGGMQQATESTRFEISGGQLKLKDGVALNYESGETSIVLAVEATDENGAGGAVTKEFTVTVRDQDDYLYGTDNDDPGLSGEQGTDYIYGLAGNDTLLGHDGNDFLYGEAGIDTLYGGGGLDRLEGGTGSDTLYGGADADNLFGGFDNDALYGEEGNDTLQGDEGQDMLYGGAGDDTLYGGADNDTLHGGEGINQLNGNEGDDLFVAGVGADAFDGGTGLDTVDYSASAAINVDMLTNVSSGGHAAGDTFTAIETVIGTAEQDVIKGDNAANILYGGAMADQLYGNGGDDTLYGDDGNDTIYGGAGIDTIYGGAGDDVLYGEGDSDTLFGGAGQDHLYGGNSSDTLYGGDDNDILEAGDAGDHLYGEGGDDLLMGGDGNDTYHFTRTSGSDTIDNYDADLGFDQIGFSADIGKENLWFEKEGRDVIIKVLGTSSQIRVLNWYDAGGNPHQDFVINLIVAAEDLSYPIDVDSMISLMRTYMDDNPGFDPASANPEIPASIQSSIYGLWAGNTAPLVTNLDPLVTVDEDSGQVTVTFNVSDAESAASALTLENITSSNDALIEDGSLSYTNTNGLIELKFTPLADANGEADIRFEVSDSGLITPKTFHVVVTAVADTPDLTVTDVSGNEGTAIALDIAAQLTDPDETLEIDVAGVPDTATLNQGINLGGGVWRLTKTQLSGLTITPAADGSGTDITLTVTARSVEDNGDTAENPKQVLVEVNGAPTIGDHTLNIDENNPVPTTVGTVAGYDPDPSGGAHGQKRYYFAGGLTTTADGLFTIDSATGVVETAGQIDYEALAGQAHQYQYDIEIRDKAGIDQVDGDYLSDTASLTITVNNVNEAPVLNVSYDPEMTAINEDVISPTGTSIATLVANGSITDPDGAEVEAIALTGLNSTNGVWEYRIGAGNWQAVGSVSVSNALLLDAGDSLRFKPNAHYHGVLSDAASFKAWDKSFGTAGSRINASAGGGASAFSEAVEQAALTVHAVNDAPVLDSNPVSLMNSITEDIGTGDGGTTIAQLVANGAITDVDGNAVEAIALTYTDNSNGYWQYKVGAGSWTNVGSVSTTHALLLGPADRLRFRPKANYHGSTGNTINYRAWDQSSGSAGTFVDASGAGGSSAFSTVVEDAKITVTPVNDAPNTPTHSYLAGSFLENTATHVATLTRVDVDGNAPTLEITSGSAYFEIRNGNQLWSLDTVNYEAIQNINVSVRARDTDNGYAHVTSGTWSHNFTVTDQNEGFILVVPSVTSISELSDFNAPTVATVSTIEDPDGGAYGTHVYSFVGGSNGESPDGKFIINPTNGQIKVNVASGGLDYEAQTGGYWDASKHHFTYTVQAQDNNGAGNVRTGDIVIPLLPVNEPPTINNVYTGNGYANAGETATFGYFDVYDPEGSVNVSVTKVSENFSKLFGNLSPTFWTVKSSTSDPTISRFTIMGYVARTKVDQRGSGSITFRPYDGQYYGVDVPVTNINYHFNGVWDNGVPVPVALDLDGDGIELISVYESNVSMNVDEDAALERIGWIGADDAWLALDKDGSGTIDHFNEISFVADTFGANTDLEGLAVYDTNLNGLLDEQDARYDEFQLWQDSNSNGLAEEGELVTLQQAGIRAIELEPTPTRDTASGATDNVITGTSRYLTADGSFGIVGDVGVGYIDDDDQEGNLADDGEEGNDVLTPVVFDLKGDGLTLYNHWQSAVYFDVDHDGDREKTGWVGSDDAMLALDRNHNGVIDNGSEISFSDDLPGAMTDLEGLAAYDSNSDGILNALDVQYSDFLVWQDENQNGISEQNELKTLLEMDIASINLEPSTTGSSLRDSVGNVVFNSSEYSRANGSTATIGDVGLRYNDDDYIEGVAPVTQNIHPREPVKRFFVVDCQHMRSEVEFFERELRNARKDFWQSGLNRKAGLASETFRTFRSNVSALQKQENDGLLSFQELFRDRYFGRGYSSFDKRRLVSQFPLNQLEGDDLKQVKAQKSASKSVNDFVESGMNVHSLVQAMNSFDIPGAAEMNRNIWENMDREGPRILAFSSH